MGKSKKEKLNFQKPLPQRLENNPLILNFYLILIIPSYYKQILALKLFTSFNQSFYLPLLNFISTRSISHLNQLLYLQSLFQNKINFILLIIFKIGNFCSISFSNLKNLRLIYSKLNKNYEA